MFSAYDLKKIIPRAIFALVAINLSWSLMTILVDLITFLGNSTEALILSPFPDELTGISLGGNAGGTLLTFATLGALGAGLGLLPIAGVALAGLTGILLAFAIILIRRVALVGLVIAAPIAIALSVFPQTENLGKKWWDWFSKLLLMYPFVMAFFALSTVSAGIISSQDNVLYKLAAVAILIAPYFVIGKAFSFAGGTIGKLAGVVNNRDKGLIDKTKKWEQGKVAERRMDARAGGRYKDNNFTRPINRTLRRVMNPGETFRLSEAGRNAAAINAQGAAVASLIKQRPELEKLSDDEAELLAMGSEQAARLRIDQRVLEAGADGEKVRKKLELAMATAKQKAGSFDNVAAQVGLGQAVKSGRIASHEIDNVAAEIARGAAGAGSQQQALKDHLISASEAGYKESSSILHAQLSTKTNKAGQRLTTGAISSVIDASDDTARSAALSTLSDDDRKLFHSTVNETFNGAGKMDLGRVGTMDSNSRASVLASKQEQVQTVLTNLSAGTISAADAAGQLAGHRADALTLAQASTDAKNSAGATDAVALLRTIDQAVATGAAGVIHLGGLTTESTKIFQSRMGGAGNRPT